MVDRRTCEEMDDQTDGPHDHRVLDVGMKLDALVTKGLQLRKMQSLNSSG